MFLKYRWIGVKKRRKELEEKKALIQNKFKSKK